MKMTSILFILWSFTAAPSFGKVPCTCYPIPESKMYQGQARQKHLYGYSINWSCKYDCKIDEDAASEKTATLTGFYSEYFIRQEIGTEGICEGMVYEPRFNMTLGREIYSFEGKTFGFIPLKSKSPQLRAWAQQNDCE